MAAPFRGRSGSAKKNYLLALGAAVAFIDVEAPTGEINREFLDAGANPPAGVRVWYWLKDKPEGEVSLTFMDADGAEIKTFTSAERDADGDDKDGDKDAPREPRLRAARGMNRFDWNMRYPNARRVPGDKTTADSLRGPLAPPGRYQVRLTLGERSQTQSFDLVKDPRAPATQADFDAQFGLLIAIRDKLSETHDNVNRIRSVRSQAREWANRAKGTPAERPVSDAADALIAKMEAAESVLIQTEYKGARDRLHLPIRWNAKLAGLTPVVSAADFAPPKQAYDVFAEYSENLDAHNYAYPYAYADAHNHANADIHAFANADANRRAHSVQFQQGRKLGDIRDGRRRLQRRAPHKQLRRR